MYIVFGNMGQIEIHYHGQLLYIDATGGDICCHQDLHPTTLELIEGPGSLRLGLVAMDRCGVNIIPVQPLRKIICAVLGAAENQGLARIFFAQLA